MWIVECNGKRHKIMLRNGALAFLSHPGVEEELEVAETLARLGGPEPTGCVGFLYFWRRNDRRSLSLLAGRYVSRPDKTETKTVRLRTEDEFMALSIEAGTARRLLLRSLRYANPELQCVVVSGWFTWRKWPLTQPSGSWADYLWLTTTPEEFMRCAVRGYNVVARRSDGKILAGTRIISGDSLATADGNTVNILRLDEVEPLGRKLGLLSEFDTTIDRRKRRVFCGERG